MARGREGADQILALDLARKHRGVAALVDVAKLRWRIERDYEELKSELGLAHFEGRGWRGFHHHATLCIATYGFLVSERETIPPSGPRPAGRSKNLPFPTITDPAAPPLRTERHVPNSIATMRRRLIVALAQQLSRCPCCQRTMPARSRPGEICDAVKVELCSSIPFGCSSYFWRKFRQKSARGSVRAVLNADGVRTWFAPRYSITSSARARTVYGTTIPSAFAVLRLTLKS